MNRLITRKSYPPQRDEPPPGRLVSLLPLAILLLLSCQTLQTDLATPAVQRTTASSPVPGTLEIARTASPPPAVTAISPGVVTACRKVRPGLQLEQVEFSGLPQAALDFLNQGGSHQELDRALYQARFASLPVPVEAADMTGDGLPEVVVAIYDPASSNFPPSGSLLLYACQAGQYRLALQVDSPAGYGAPSLRYLVDLNADEQAELVASFPVCGASSCFEDVRIYAWNGQDFSNRLEGATTDLPTPDIRLVDLDGNRVFDLELAGGALGSVGAGPQRGLIRRWKYDPLSGTWRNPVDELQPSQYRIHVLHDAEQAASEGKFDLALTGYQRVVSDPQLADWMDPPIERANLAAYALFKAAVVHLMLQEASQAEDAFNTQARSFLPGQPGYAYVQLAGAFQEAYSSGGVSGGCAAARRFAADHPKQVLAPLSPQVFGYANRDFFPLDICPWE